ncbi:hypothetical protein BRARA_B00067 [Brassica rapa]|uniref:AMP-binding enzyme C-terminal domain-containing protein n=2 Tax=Brassica campestris TaxID=3711 RepID=A0A398A7J1_BRACM|nr:hypothetical protein BRARA_B00067 [Brassica rapa]CAG7862512.1 unnamed protein product [Brassica rapa]CAG7891717.1 unnamed protein product [Brassica rapa]CAG7903317.1 unnamed protein product [Brassica rapa]
MKFPLAWRINIHMLLLPVYVTCVFLTRTLIKFSRFPDEDAVEIPMAFIVRKPGSNLNEAQVIDFVAKQVAPYKKVRRVAFINAITLLAKFCVGSLLKSP